MKAPRRIGRGWQDWLPPDQEWLEHEYLILEKSAAQITREIDCSDPHIVQAWIHGAGLREPKSISDDSLAPFKIGYGSGTRFIGVTRKWLIQEYVENDKSAKQIADEIETTHVTVIRWLKQHNVPLRDREAMNRRHSRRMRGEGNPAWVNGNSQNHQRNKLERSGRSKLCEWCGTTKKLQIHHRDHDRTNHDLDNLAWFCGICNRLEADLWMLQRDEWATVRVDSTDHRIEVQFNRR